MKCVTFRICLRSLRSMPRSIVSNARDISGRRRWIIKSSERSGRDMMTLDYGSGGRGWVMVLDSSPRVPENQILWCSRIPRSVLLAGHLTLRKIAIWLSKNCKKIWHFFKTIDKKWQFLSIFLNRWRWIIHQTKIFTIGSQGKGWDRVRDRHLYK